MTVKHNHIHKQETRSVPGKRRVILEENDFEERFKDGVQEAKENVNEEEVEDFLSSGLTLAVLNEIRLGFLEESLQQTQSSIESAHTDGMGVTINEVRAKGISGANITDQSTLAQNFVENRTGRMISEISDQTRAGIRSVIRNGIQNNLAPSTVANNVRSVIGLDSRRASAVANFRRLLQQQDKRAIGRFLDASEKAKVRSIVQSGGTQAEINQLTQKYAQHQLNLRSRAIARTELNKAYNMGKLNQARELVSRGVVDGERIAKVWRTNPPNVCSWCLELEGQTVGIEETYSASVEYETQPGSNTMSSLVPGLHSRCKCEISIEIL